MENHPLYLDLFTENFLISTMSQSAVCSKCSVRLVSLTLSVAAFLTQTVQTDAETAVKYEIWDTAGQERFQSLAPMYYRGAGAAIVAYSITDPV